MDTKNFLTSKTFQGIAVMLIVSLLKMFKIDVGNEEASAVVEPALLALGAAWAAYGRVKAEKAISVGPGVKNTLSAILVALMLMSVAACTDFQRAAYISIESARVSVDTGMKVCADLRVQDKITIGQWEDIAAVHGKVINSGAAASKAMSLYAENHNEALARPVIQSLLDEAGYFIERVEQVTGKKLPVTLKMLF